MMRERITVLIKEAPDSRFISGTWTRLKKKDAYELSASGYVVGYDPNTKEEFPIVIPEDFPHREKLFKNGIYTEQEVRDCEDLVALKYIGDVYASEIREYLEREEDAEG